MKDLLTNEGLRKLFKNNFEMANFAIQVGRFNVKAGKEISLSGILDEVKKHPTEQCFKDYMEGIG
jgi:hypothetical protein